MNGLSVLGNYDSLFSFDRVFFKVQVLYDWIKIQSIFREREIISMKVRN